MMRGLLSSSLTAFELTVVTYCLAVNSLYLVSTVFSYLALLRHRRRWSRRELGALMRSRVTPGVSIIVPAWNEEAGIVAAVRSLLTLNYPCFEIVVVSDGSTDGTIARLQEEFGLVRAPGTYEALLPTAAVAAIHRSPVVPEVVVLEKANGGKSDAVNAGLNVARYPLVCIIDADSIIEPDALSRAVLPFLEDPTTVAVGGIVRIGNGCIVDSGRVTDVRAPRSWLARFQVVEYLRAFLAARVTQSAFNAMLIVSGAFGLFRRDVVVAAGGLSTSTVGEDMELIVRLHQFCRDTGRPYRVVFQPDPVVWTEAPESLAALAGQRNRWQRGTLQVLAVHRRMLGNPRYGRVGLLAFPYYLLFEALGPLIELAGVVAAVPALMAGLLGTRMALLVFLAAILYGTMISVAAVLLEELSFRRYLRLRDVVRLLLAAVVENFGYRQLTVWWRLRGFVDFCRGRNTWIAVPRKGLTTA